MALSVVATKKAKAVNALSIVLTIKTQYDLLNAVCLLKKNGEQKTGIIFVFVFFCNKCMPTCGDNGQDE